TTLAGAPLVVCSALSGHGLTELRAALDAALDAAPPRPDAGRPRLPVDRVFTVAGFGTVVTGTLQDGRLRVGQEVELLPHGRRGRIRGLQAHRHPLTEGLPGGRVAVNVAGVAKSETQRGDVLALPGTLRASTALDVRLEVVANAPQPLAHNATLEVYAGAAQTQARVLLLEGGDALAAGTSGWAQLRLAHPLVVARGDRFIVRQPSPSLTVGGGTVIELQPRRHRRRDAAVLARLAALAQGEPADLVLAALRPAGGPAHKLGGYGGQTAGELAERTGLPSDDIAAAVNDLAARGAVVRAGDVTYAAEQMARLRSDARELLDAHHRQYPLRPGMPREEWRARLALTPREAAQVAAALAALGDLAEISGDAAGRGAFVKRAGHTPRLSAEQERAVAALLVRFRAAPFAPPVRAEVEQALGAEVTAALIERGTLLKVGETLLLEPATFAEAVRRVVEHLRTHGRLTVAEARDLLGTSRKYMLPILERLDEQHITRRAGDDRVLGLRAPAPVAGSDPDAADD
ncbi:MAG: SelB C-terminal domain-containing protein, partial [Ktedonobacterales bacterium]